MAATGSIDKLLKRNLEQDEARGSLTAFLAEARAGLGEADPIGKEARLPEPPAPDAEQTSAAGTGQKGRSGWLSPRYTTLRQVQLDPDALIRNRCVAFRSDLAEVEYYRVLRTRILQRTRVTGGNTIMITSALPGDGKTLTAINLALTFAREFSHTALLVDGDLKRQKIQEYLGYRGEKGLADHLLDDCPVAEMMVWPGIEKLTLISGGTTVDESAELIGSPRMRELVQEMKGRYPDRYILFDVPAVLAGADALAFAHLVDHILVTVRAGQTSFKDLQRALSLLPREKILGLVLNREHSRA